MKRFDIFYSFIALADLDRIWDEIYAVSSNFDTADNYISGIRDAVRQMSARPKTGIPLYYSDIFTGVYMITYKKYVAFYRIRGERVEIGRVLLGSSDYMSKILDFMDTRP